MTDPAGGAPTPQDSGNWQTPPPAPMPGGFQAAPPAAGPAPGVAYADVVTRIIAAVIDGVILWIGFVILAIVGGLIAIAGAGLIIGLLFGVIWAAGTLVYYVYTWTTMRASPGQKVLNLETVNAADGATLTRDQAIRRWAFLWGPVAVGYIIPIIGLLIVLVAMFYELYLLYTVTQSPKRQGYHDVQAGTVVVKRAA